MLINRLITPRSIPVNVCRRYISNKSLKDGKRFIQTIPIVNGGPNFYSGFNYSISGRNNIDMDKGADSERWSKHSLNSLDTLGDGKEVATTSSSPVLRRSRASRFSNKVLRDIKEGKPKSAEQPPVVKSNSVNAATTAEEPAVQAQASQAENKAEIKPKKRRTLRPRKALITLTPNAIKHLKDLINQPEPQLIRIGVQNRGCSGLTYNLEYVSKPGKFDELVEQDDVKVLIDSKALFSIVGSEMDWLDDKLSSRFIFKNPNSKGTCGCGESFMV